MEQVRRDLQSHHGQNSLTSQITPKRIFPRTESDHKRLLQQSIIDSTSISSSSNKKKSKATDPLDEAMKELLDICQQYNDKLTIKISDRLQNDSKRHEQTFPIKAHVLERHYCPEKFSQQARQQPTMALPKPSLVCDMDKKDVVDGSHVTSSFTQIGKSANTDQEFIEKLQQRQIELQAQLDDVQETAKVLASKQKKKLNSILEVDDNLAHNTLDDDDDELIEFQQIENELRISELNRQLDKIQEEIRLRLYKQLMVNTKNGSCNSKSHIHHLQNNDRGVNGSSPCSSTCSDEPTSSSNSNSAAHSHHHKTGANSQYVIVKSSESEPGESIETNLNHLGNDRQLSVRSQGSIHPSKKTSTHVDKYPPKNDNLDRQDFLGTPSNDTPDTGIQSNNLSNVDSAGDYEILTASKESVDSSRRCPSAELATIYNNISDYSNHIACPPLTTTTVPPRNSNISPTCFSHYRESSTNSDLERIEEDEEDQDYYGNSDHFRTIYEEKLSPVFTGQSPLSSTFSTAPRDVSNNPPDACNGYGNVSSFNRQDSSQKHILASTTTSLQSETFTQRYHQSNISSTSAKKHGYQQLDTTTESAADDRSSSFNETEYISESSNSFLKCSFTASSDKPKMPPATMTTNRPLTLYLPKPDEEIDLVEHIQALGHDLNIISNDLKIDPTCAHGYLWKCCSSNNKKWLKRYFHFDRTSKTLSYYATETQLVKKQATPKNIIHFDDINDVYVDHKLSGIGEKDRSSKRKNYVFVLSTASRKYLLASLMAETMRVWIDILFTGVTKADDYFQQMAPLDKTS